MRFLVRMTSDDLSRESLLSTVRSLAKSVGAEARAAKWTSYGALEVDIFCQSESDFDLFLSVLRPIATTEFTKNLSIAPPYKTEQELYEEARTYFNEERYWECHEVLEGIWKTKKDPEKRFLQSVILVCAAFVHHQKGEESVALGVLKRAYAQLDYPQTDFAGISIPDLRSNVESTLANGRFSEFRI